MAAPNLLAATVIHWNTARPGETLAEREVAGLPVPPEFLSHTSPLGWAHILLTGKYKWPKTVCIHKLRRNLPCNAHARMVVVKKYWGTVYKQTAVHAGANERSRIEYQCRAKL